ncbi:hypothetical protein [uncultured Tateyamaria sp.]|uniref:hypothetical protein n=1 Tax=uncultured Tateyamaria sp. TaxID=455651 RepID=UPI0026170079|nr:hypothetical protein [uncultured Tateyamaria sp.]
MEKYLAGFGFFVLLIVIAEHLGVGTWLEENQTPITSSTTVAWVTSLSTAVLAVLTFFLAKATTNMAAASSSPQVVASIEVNQWSVIHFDLVVENTGNAPAFDIKVDFANPPKLSKAKGEVPFPFSRISLLRPGQNVTSYLADFQNLKDESYIVNVSWKAKPDAPTRDSLSYQLDMNSVDGVSFLGKPSALIQVAEELKKIRDDWKPVASGNRRLDVDVYSQQDRDTKKAELDAWRDEMQKKRRETQPK